jgi:hypothetical protein
MDGVRLSAFEAAPLRYVLDVLTGEFVTVGVVLLCPEREFLGCRLPSSFARVSTVFRDADVTHVRRLAVGIAAKCEEWQERGTGQLGFDRLPASLPLLMPKLLQVDEPGMQFSPVVASGVTADPARQLEELFERFVGPEREVRERLGRSDDEVWREFTSALPDPELTKRFHAHTVNAPHLAVEFKYAWKNASWHAVQPVSLDMVDAEKIVNKALLWSARLEQLSPRDRQLELKLLVALPQSKRSRIIRQAADDGMAILAERAEKHARVVNETDRRKLATQVADELSHAA